MTIIYILCLFIIGTIPTFFGAVQPWVWSFYSSLIITGYLLLLWSKPNQPSKSNTNFTPKTVSIFFIWTLILCLHLPYKIISFLSPTRAILLSQTSELTQSSLSFETISYLPKNALALWIFLLSVAFFYIVVRNLCIDRKMLKGIVAIMITVGLLESLYGLVQALVPSMGVLWVDYVKEYMGTARGTFINRNNFAAFIEMIWPLALGVTLATTDRARSLKEALGSKKLNQQAMMAMGIIVFLLTLILTRSRAGIFSGFIGFFTFFFIVRFGINKMAKHTRVMLSGIIILLCIYTMTIGIGPILERFLAISGDGSSRINIWGDSLSIVRDHPFGIGLQNYENVFKVYNRSFTSDKVIIHAHNDYLQLLIESGWIGFISIVGGLLVFLKKSLNRIKKIDFISDPLRYYIAVGAFSGLISASVHSLFDFNLQIPANLLYFAVLMAVLRACTKQKLSLPKSTPSFTHIF